jgi:hypothetical protein
MARSTDMTVQASMLARAKDEERGRTLLPQGASARLTSHEVLAASRSKRVRSEYSIPWSRLQNGSRSSAFRQGADAAGLLLRSRDGSVLRG